MHDENQIILVDKPAGISSFGVVAKVRGYLKTQFGHKVKVGHTGTLDPFATGLLILLTGKNTKKSGDFLKLDKEYGATLRLGYTSTTGDPEGEISKVDSAVRPTREELEAVFQKFVGKIEQTPPRYSAIKINGQRAYKLARQGKEFETPARKVEICGLEIIDYQYPEVKIKAQVSSGTYIRTLAEDIGKALGSGAYLTELRRTKIANYSVTNAQKLEEFLKDE